MVFPPTPMFKPTQGEKEARREKEASLFKSRQERVERVREKYRGEEPVNKLPTSPFGTQTYQSPLPTVNDAHITPLVQAVGVPGATGDEFTASDAVDFLFGGELAILGIKQDAAGWSFTWENMVEQWSEEPLWLNMLNTASLGATFVVPAAKPFVRAAAGMGVLGKGLKAGELSKKARKAMHLQDFKDAGYLDEGIQSLDDATEKTLHNIFEAKYRYSYHRNLTPEEGVPASFIAAPFKAVATAFRHNFSNDYMQITDLIGTEKLLRTQYYKNVDALVKAEDFGRFFNEIPTDSSKVYQHFLHRINPSVVPSVKLTQAEARWADAYWEYARRTQREMLEDGLIDEDTFRRIGEVHIPALTKGTPPPVAGLGKSIFIPLKKKAGRKSVEDNIEFLRINRHDIPQLDWDTLKTRKGNMPEVYERLLADELITAPSELTVRGLITDKLIQTNFRFIRDIAMDKNLARTHDDILSVFKTSSAAKKAGWRKLDDGVPPNVAKRLTRMINKKGGSIGDEGLPWVKQEVFDELYGSSGIFAQSVYSAGALEVLSAIHKTAKTTLNIPTQFMNIVGNMVFLGLRGHNMFSSENIKLFQESANAFRKISRTYTDQKKAGVSVKNILDVSRDTLDLGKVKIGNKTLDLAKEILDPQVRDLIEESAFDHAEGFSHLMNLAAGIKKGNAARTIAETAIAAKKAAQFGDRVQWMDKAAKLYLAGDMVPKMAYYLSLRGKGLTKQAAILEVGRSLPMYSTVGAKIKSGRRWAFPWLSFPVEALRIIKNNLQDYPLRVGAMLHTPNAMQSLFSLAGVAPQSPQALEEAKRSLPTWAQKRTTVVAEQGAQETVGSATSGGLLGGIVGAVKGGPRGAVLGAAAGALGATGFTKALSALQPGRDDELRGAILDWMPHSSFLYATDSPDAGSFLGVAPGHNLHEAVGNLPAEPFGIFMPLFNIATGRTPFGEDIVATSKGEQLKRTFTGLMEWLFPPMVSRYMFKSYGSAVPVTQAVGLGTTMASLDPTNITRGLIDSGIAIDPNTGKPGSPSADGFMNNFTAWRSYAMHPEGRLINEERSNRELSKVRTALSRDLSFHLENGHDTEVKNILGSVMSSFTRQYPDDPAMAQEKYSKWLQRRLRDVGRHPRLRTWSNEELALKLREVSQFSAGERSKVREMLFNRIREQMAIRQAATRSADKGDLFMQPPSIGVPEPAKPTKAPSLF